MRVGSCEADSESEEVGVNWPLPKEDGEDMVGACAGFGTFWVMMRPTAGV